MSKDNIETIFLTGGGLKLQATGGKSLQKLLCKDLEKQLMQPYPFCKVSYSEEPQLGSIFNGAKVMFAMPQFDSHMCVTKKEWEHDDKVVMKKFF